MYDDGLKDGAVLIKETRNNRTEEFEYDTKGNVIKKHISYTYKDDQGNVLTTGYNEFFDYNEQEKLVHYKSDAEGGEEWWREYNEKGKLIHFKDNHNYEETWIYSTDEPTVRYIDSNGFTSFSQHDDNGNTIYYKNNQGIETKTWYDEHQNVVRIKNNCRGEITEESWEYKY